MRHQFSAQGLSSWLLNSARRSPLALLLLGGFWLLAMVMIYDVAVYSQFFLRFPAGGVSFWKSYFFCIWLMLCAAFCIVSRAEDFPGRILLALLLAIGGIGLGLHISLTHELGLPRATWVLFASDGSVSSHSLFHSHILKGTVAWILDFLGIPAPRPADTGLPFLKFVPSGVFAIVVILYGFLSFVVLSAVRVFASNREFSFRVLLYAAILTYYPMRGVIDGGLIGAEFVASLPFVVWFALKRDFSAPARWFWIALVLAIGTVETLRSVLRSDSVWADYPKDVVLQFCFLAGLTAVLLMKRLQVKQLALGGALLLAALVINRESYSIYDLEYLGIEHQPGDQVVISSFAGFPYPGEVLLRDNKLTVYKLNVDEDISNWDLHRLNRIPPGYRNIYRIGDQCRLGGRYDASGSLVLPQIQKDLPTDCSDGVAHEMRLLWWKNRAVVEGSLRGCVADTGNVTVAYRLMNCGVSSFVFVPNGAIVRDL